MTTFDAIATRILLADKMTEAQRASALKKHSDMARTFAGERCPACKCTDIEDNGHKGRWAEYRCTACDHRFGPGAEA